MVLSVSIRVNPYLVSSSPCPRDLCRKTFVQRSFYIQTMSKTMLRKQLLAGV